MSGFLCLYFWWDDVVATPCGSGQVIFLVLLQVYATHLAVKAINILGSKGVIIRKCLRCLEGIDLVTVQCVSHLVVMAFGNVRSHVSQEHAVTIRGLHIHTYGTSKQE